MLTRDLNINVIEATERRIYEMFQKNKTVSLSFSGGKDSLCMSDMLIKTMQKYGISFSRLVVVFFDEEAIYPDVERITMQWRSKFMSLGAKFYWFCLPIRHYNCCNRLANDESFICWEPGKENIWVRPMPKFAIRNHKKFKMGMSYQQFGVKLFSKIPQIIGLRVSESIQRRSAIGSMKESKFIYPIYDWKDKDVWLYLYNNNITIPETYIYLYKTGIPLNKLRISQFFSIDTIKTLPKIFEFYPNLYEKVQQREPNIDLVMLYWDTDMFRSSKQDRAFNLNDKKDYKANFINELKKASLNPEEYAGYTLAKRLYSNCTSRTSNRTYHALLQVLIAGDPKKRMYRALLGKISRENFK